MALACAAASYDKQWNRVMLSKPGSNWSCRA